MKPVKWTQEMVRALLDGTKPFTRDQWFTLPMELRHRWWRETDYGNQPPSQSLITAIHDFLHRKENGRTN